MLYILRMNYMVDRNIILRHETSDTSFAMYFLNVLFQEDLTVRSLWVSATTLFSLFVKTKFYKHSCNQWKENPPRTP